MKIYLDNAATTRMSEKVLDAMRPYQIEDFGNPSSIHSLGQKASEALERARISLAEKLGAHPSELYFTGSGTESNNIALKGVAYANKDRGRHIITTKIEHASILKPLVQLEKEGFEVEYLNVDNYGLLEPNLLSEKIRDDTLLVSVGHANNEIGTIQDIEALGKITREKGALFHTDACQSFTKEKLDVVSQNLDLVTINAHKIHGPKGVGGLYIRLGTKVEPIITGGGQESSVRSGTQNVPGIVGFAKAAELLSPISIEKMRVQRNRIIAEILERVKGVRLNGHPTKRLCNNINLTFDYIEGESLVLRLDARGVAASTASACSSKSLEPSYVLMALGLSPENSHGTLRLSISHETRDIDIESSIDAIITEVGNLRKISPLTR